MFSNKPQENLLRRRKYSPYWADLANRTACNNQKARDMLDGRLLPLTSFEWVQWIKSYIKEEWDAFLKRSQTNSESFSKIAEEME